MKLIYLITATILLNFSNISFAQKNIQNVQIEYVASTRGFYQKIVILNQTIAISNDRNDEKMPEATKIGLKDWKILIAEYNKMKLINLAKLKAPTEKRLYDGAPIANLSISNKGKTYESQAFDHGFPPLKIKKFVDKITSLAKTE
jgi:hypothetical protein